MKKHVNTDRRVEILERDLRSENFDRPQYHYALRMLKKLNPQHKNIVEFGSGRGEFARLLAQNGYNVLFTDINPLNVRWAIDNGFKAVVFDANEKSSHFSDNQFDGAIMLEMIEHIPNAGYFLNETNRILKKGGYLVLSTPNPYFLWKRLSIVLGNPIDGEGYHYRFFTYSSLKNSLDRAGFEITNQMHHTSSFGINFLFKYLHKHPIDIKIPETLFGLFVRKFYLIAIKK
jgi:2-polyprenyl-3-methyl-5-hydroxy-6-metoxy-1,4-benzoquinol methylase